MRTSANQNCEGYKEFTVIAECLATKETDKFMWVQLAQYNKLRLLGYLSSGEYKFFLW